MPTISKSSFKRMVKRRTPWRFRRFVRRFSDDVGSIPSRLKSDKQGPRPWRLLHDSGSGDFFAVGARQAKLILEASQIASDAQILDIGCGNGRVALPLAHYLSAHGGYTGFDVSAAAIDFAQRTLAHVRPDFVFRHVDLANGEYNPKGKIKPEAYAFPCDDSSQDLVIATSVFTHLKPSAARAFLSETARVLKPSGVAYITAYLVDQSARDALASPEHPYPLYPVEFGVWATDPRAPEAGIGFDQTFFDTMIAKCGLTYADQVRRGGWAQGDYVWDHQDALLLKRRSYGDD